jgi:hypothetical protein
LSIDIHRLHFKESISNNQCRSNHGDLQSIHLLDVCVYHLHPDAVNREGRRSIIDWDDRRRALAVIIFRDGIISACISHHLTMCFSIVVNPLFYHDIICKMNPTTTYANGRLGSIIKS